MTRGQRSAAERDKDEVDHLQDSLEADQADYADRLADGSLNDEAGEAEEAETNAGRE